MHEAQVLASSHGKQGKHLETADRPAVWSGAGEGEESAEAHMRSNDDCVGSSLGAPGRGTSEKGRSRQASRCHRKRKRRGHDADVDDWDVTACLVVRKGDSVSNSPSA